MIFTRFPCNDSRVFMPVHEIVISTCVTQYVEVCIIPICILVATNKFHNSHKARQDWVDGSRNNPRVFPRMRIHVMCVYTWYMHEFVSLCAYIGAVAYNDALEAIHSSKSLQSMWTYICGCAYAHVALQNGMYVYIWAWMQNACRRFFSVFSFDYFRHVFFLPVCGMLTHRSSRAIQ